MKQNVLRVVINILFFALAVSAQPEKDVQLSGGATAGGQNIEIDNNSAKYSEYRDLVSDFYLYDLRLNLNNRNNGMFLDFSSTNLLRNDQKLNLDLKYKGLGGFEFESNSIPQNLSFQAKTPYFSDGNGVFVVPQTVGIQAVDSPAVGTPSLGPTIDQMAVNDQLIGDYIADNVHPVDLKTERNRTTATLTLTPVSLLDIRLSYMDETRNGNRMNYGPIGDRPPRTMNIQFTEPIDYLTREVRAEAGFTFSRFQGQLAYQLSNFKNEIDRVIWQNIYFEPNAGDHTQTEGGTIHQVSSFGQMALPPDNRSHNITGIFGIDLPLKSRLTGLLSYGVAIQDEKLLPYSYMGFIETSTTTNPEQIAWNDTDKLPRLTAKTEIETKLFNADYSINPVKQLNLRTFFRYYDLDNNTESDQWRYVTQDVVSASGGVNYRNNRLNMPYAYDKMNYGLEGSYFQPQLNSTLRLAVEREEIYRDFREADTKETIFRATISSRPINWTSIRAKYTYGNRGNAGYNSQVTQQSYWYTEDQSPTAPALDRDNPKFAFANHPDLRKYDVTDRSRNQLDVSATVNPLGSLGITASYAFQNDDYSSDIKPSQPLLNFNDNDIAEVDRNRFTVGDQLGLLEDTRMSYGLDVSYAASERVLINAFANQARTQSDMRGMFFNENRRETPSTINTDITNLGRWDDPRYIWNLSLLDLTNTAGLGAGYEIIPGIQLSIDGIYSYGEVNFRYSGYGTDFSQAATPTEWETFQFGFRTPETTYYKQYTFNTGLDVRLIQNLSLGIQYTFDRYVAEDWMLEPSGPWVEQVESPYYLRDTSEDNRWGNRLVNMDGLFDPVYVAHIGKITLTYDF